MSMTSIKLRKILEKRLDNPGYRTSYNREKDLFRVEWKDSKEGMSIKLGVVAAKYNERGEAALTELEDHIVEALRMMKEQPQLTGMERQIFPVIRATSFPTETKAGKKLVTDEHTAETRIYYALDRGKSYQILDEALLEKEGWTKERVQEVAAFNVRSLATTYTEDEVAENKFYFVASQDGYDASRILNLAFLEEMKANSRGDLALAVPHQDVLIIADLVNDTGYDILAQMTMKFFAEGRIPITSLPFIYEDQKLEPIFILAQNKPHKK